jgi:hypothetical protein
VKFNREKIAAVLALLILVLGLKEAIFGLASPTGGLRVPDISIPRRAREVLPRKYRTFTEEGALSRNPFSFSEGWQRMEAPPLPAPPVPGPSLVLPSLGGGATALEAGFLYEDRRPPEAALAAAANGGDEAGNDGKEAK